MLWDPQISSFKEGGELEINKSLLFSDFTVNNKLLCVSSSLWARLQRFVFISSWKWTYCIQYSFSANRDNMFIYISPTFAAFKLFMWDISVPPWRHTLLTFSFLNGSWNLKSPLPFLLHNMSPTSRFTENESYIKAWQMSWGTEMKLRGKNEKHELDLSQEADCFKICSFMAGLVLWCP